ncbi:MAG TPA: hypothetical protein VFW39_08525 [Sphingomicrobium sp.]|nr:hypothetical protein [Sphingomicrobium sp.]
MSARQKGITALSMLSGFAFAALLFAPLFVKGISSVAQGILIGVAGAVCIAGVGFGIWDARRIEAKRKAKERIWLNH